MSRRENRDADSKRHRSSRFDREPSPKRSRRDGKPETERPPTNLNPDSRNYLERDQKHRRRLHDALPVDASVAQDTKQEARAEHKESGKPNERREGTRPSDLTDASRSRSYFQHDERGNAGQVGRSFSRRSGSERGWWKDSKEDGSEKANGKTNIDMRERDDKGKVRGEDNRAWRHDRYFEMEADPKPPVRKRPAFRETKLPVDTEKTDKASAEALKENPSERPLFDGERKDDSGPNARHSDRPERPFAGDREKRGEAWRSNMSPRDRYGPAGSFRGRDRFPPRQGNRTSGVRVEKWKHDLYDETNRSPTPKNEEDHIAKVEALLAS